MIARNPTILRQRHRLYATPRDLRRPHRRRTIRRLTIAAALAFIAAAAARSLGVL